MELTAIVLITALLFAWALVSARLERADLTAPIVFTAVGAALAWSGLVDGSSPPEGLTPMLELTLVWVLFSDAARLPLQQLRRDVGHYVRLLGVGLPLTIVFGWALAVWFFPQFGLWLALLVGAALAPTDAALGVPVVTNPAVPSRIRQLITVESGLNDGIATPVVMIAIAGAAAAAGLESATGPGGAAVELLIGAGVGAAAGAAGGWLLRLARRHGTAAEDFAGIGVLALSLLAYTGALAAGGNGFVAAFCAGLAFGTSAGRRGPAELIFVEQMGGLVSLLVWLFFGAIAIPTMLANFVPLTLVYAALSLTVVRMVPVALASIGTGLTGTPSCLWAGSVRAALPRSCSRCWRWKPLDPRPIRRWPSSRPPSCSVSWPTASAPRRWPPATDARPQRRDRSPEARCRSRPPRPGA